MRLSLLTAGAASALLLSQFPVMAQNDTNQHSGGAAAEQSINSTTGSTSATGSSSAAGMSSHGSIRTQLQSMLQNQGYSDVRVTPTSFLVRAKDKDGNSILMSVSLIQSRKLPRSALSGPMRTPTSTTPRLTLPPGNSLQSRRPMSSPRTWWDSTSTTTTTRVSARSKTWPGTRMAKRRRSLYPLAASLGSARTMSRSTHRRSKLAITRPTRSGTRQ